MAAIPSRTSWKMAWALDVDACQTRVPRHDRANDMVLRCAVPRQVTFPNARDGFASLVGDLGKLFVGVSIYLFLCIFISWNIVLFK
jgi:hypothetical protein